MLNTPLRFGPFYLPNAVGNLINPPTLTGGTHPVATKTYILLKHIRIVNTTSGPLTFTLYIGGTGGSTGGTQFMGASKTIAANDSIDWYGSLRLDTTDFLTGLASASNSLVFEAEGEMGIQL